MRTIHSLLLALASLAVLVMAEGNVLFPYMYGLKYTEYDEAKKLGLTRTWLLFRLDETVTDKSESVCLQV